MNDCGEIVVEDHHGCRFLRNISAYCEKEQEIRRWRQRSGRESGTERQTEKKRQTQTHREIDNQSDR